MQTLQDANDTFFHLLQSFAVLMSERPDDAELGDKTVSQCDEEIRTLESVRKALERRVILVYQKRNTFAPINTLPPELLVKIFAITASNNRDTPSSDPATLSLVCQHWNRLADATPSLWTGIYGATMSVAKIVRALEKSRYEPLDIIACTDESLGQGGARQGAFLNDIIPHAHRWREVTLAFENVDQGLEDITTSSMPLLESLSLTGDKYFGWVRPEPLDLFGGWPPPKLRKLWLEIIPVPWSPTILCHLTMLSISYILELGPSLDQLVAVLSACPDLKSLSVSQVIFMDGASTPPPNLVHMPALETLELRKLETEIMNMLLASINAPNCKSGELECTVMGDPLQTLFTSDVSHFFDHIRSHPVVSSIASHFGFTINRTGSWNITLNLESLTFAKDTLIWLSPSSPIRISIYGLGTPLTDILAAVTDMGELYRIDFGHGFEAPVSDALTFLATCGSAQVGTPSRWLFPELVEMSFIDPCVGDGWDRLLLMLQRRQGAPETQGDAQHPKPLRKLVFGSETWHPGVDDPVITDFSSTCWPNWLHEVRRLLGPEGELLWYGRVVTEEGACCMILDYISWDGTAQCL